MKNFVKILLITLTFFLISVESQVFAAQNNMENAVLIERYLTSHKVNIIDYATRYGFIDDKEVLNWLAKLDILITSLRKIQAGNAWDEENAVWIILVEIKKINIELEATLKLKKYYYNKKLQSQKEIFANIWKQLSVQLEKLCALYYPSIKDKTTFTDKEKRLKTALEILVLLSNDVKTFNNRNFDTIEEMQSSFLWTLNSIKYYIMVVRENVK